MKQNLFAIILLLSVQCAFAQGKKYSMANVHSHNDYEHANPFYAAFNSGAGSIEADIFLKDGELYVAHDSADIRKEKTLAKMYLDPLKQTLPVNKLILLIDLKTKAQPTLNALINLLKKYGTITTSTALKIVISGNRPPSSLWTSYPTWIFFDGRPNEDYDETALTKVGLISESFRKYSQWKGDGELEKADRRKINSAIKNAHKLNKPFRFWATPDTPDAWRQLMKLKVDYINTDKIQDIAHFMQKQ